MSLRALSQRAIWRDTAPQPTNSEPAATPPTSTKKAARKAVARLAAAQAAANRAADQLASVQQAIAMQTAPQQIVPQTTAKPTPEQASAADGTDTSGLQSIQHALTDSIPTEVLSGYTVLVAVIVANTTATELYQPLRWGVFGLGIAFVVLYILVPYLRSSPAADRRHIPAIELSAALVAYAAWALSMPGSPLGVTIHGGELAITSAAIAVGGATLLGLFVTPLNQKSSKGAATS